MEASTPPTVVGADKRFKRVSERWTRSDNASM